jgi:hypothetical protein
VLLTLEQPDALKPALEGIIHKLVESFTGEDKEFYEREFKFFGEVTAISGYLKEYIKYGQNEKKPLQKVIAARHNAFEFAAKNINVICFRNAWTKRWPRSMWMLVFICPVIQKEE